MRKSMRDYLVAGAIALSVAVGYLAVVGFSGDPCEMHAWCNSHDGSCNATNDEIGCRNSCDINEQCDSCEECDY